jgi:hypothetical protein
MSLINEFNSFKETFTNQDEAMRKNSDAFKKFWDTMIMKDTASSLDDSDLDPIIRLIDIRARGHTREDIALALTSIRMGRWYRTFRSIKENQKIKSIINKLFILKDDKELIKCLNDLERENSGLKNGLTGEKAVAINAILCLTNPNYYVSALSLEDRGKIIKYLCNDDARYETLGEKTINTNRKILDYFKSIGIMDSPRTITQFLYSIRNQWDSSPETENEETDTSENTGSDEQTFQMEEDLEDFLISNWEKTELGKKYNLIYEGGELISQQYKTDIGRIDILAQEKSTNTYVVIELKKQQASDQTIGQLARYMGWVKAKKANNGAVKGIIISYTSDEKLSYALRTFPDVELLLYKISFSLVVPDEQI